MPLTWTARNSTLQAHSSGMFGCRQTLNFFLAVLSARNEIAACDKFEGWARCIMKMVMLQIMHLKTICPQRRTISEGAGEPIIACATLLPWLYFLPCN